MLFVENASDALASGAFYVFKVVYMDLSALLGLSIIAVAAITILSAEGLLASWKHVAAAMVFFIAAFVLRAFCMDHVTLDYTNFLSGWVAYFRENGGVAALSGSVGNYNLPYLYFLALISYSGASDLYLIKLVSVFFDVILAFASMKLVSVFRDNREIKLLTFLAVLLMPTVILNGAMWGQCDSIYTAFGVLAIYLALSDRPAASMAAMALSFAFKLQAVFIMPVFVILLIMKRIKVRHFLIFPLTYVIAVLPAVIAGRPFIQTLTLYFDQAGTVGSGLNYNSPSIYSFVRSTGYEEVLGSLGIMAAFLFVFAVAVLVYYRRGDALIRFISTDAECPEDGRSPKSHASNRLILTVTALFTVAIPFLLPHMHDRYFFPADIFTLIFAIVLPSYFAVPVLVSFASLLSYYAYLNQRYLILPPAGAIAIIAALLLLITEILSQTGLIKLPGKRETASGEP